MESRVQENAGSRTIRETRSIQKARSIQEARSIQDARSKQVANRTIKARAPKEAGRIKEHFSPRHISTRELYRVITSHHSPR